MACTHSMFRYWIFSAPIALMLVWIVITETMQYRHTGQEIETNARHAASAYANTVREKLNHQLTALEFAGSLLNTANAPMNPALSRLYSLHPNLFEINVFSANGKAIIWSTYPQNSAPLVPPDQFSPLKPGTPILLGKSTFSERYHSYVLPMRYRITDDTGETTHFIGTPFRLDTILNHVGDGPWIFTIVDTRDDAVIGQWNRNSVTLRPTNTLPSKTVTPVEGFPIAIRTSWAPGIVRHSYWQSAQQRWLMEIIMLSLLAAISLMARNFLIDRELAARRLRCLSDFNRMFAEINHIIATSEQESDLLQAICDFGIAYGKFNRMWIGQPSSTGKFIFLASSAHASILNGTRCTAEYQPSPGLAISMRAWREGQPVFSTSADAMRFIIGTGPKIAPLDKDSVASLPIKRQGIIWAILTIYHQVPDGFTDLNIMLEELAEDISRGLDRLDLLQREQHTSSLNQAILDSSSAGILLVRNQTIHFANQQLAELLGVTHPYALIGRHLAEFLNNPKDQNQLHQQASEAFSQGKQLKFEASFRRQDGTTRWFSLTGNPFPEEGGFEETWIVIDITEHRLLINKQLLLASALAAVREGVALTDSQQLIIYVNEAFVGQTGFTLSDVQGQTIGTFLAQTNRPELIDPILQATRHGDTFQGQAPIHRKRGGPFWSLLTITPIREESTEISHSVMVFRDISALRQLNDRLPHLSLHDELTQLPNRRALEQHLHQRIGAMRRDGRILAVGIIDLDDFKPINDTWGHEAGDTLLKILAQRLQAQLRAPDLLARLAGDEFVIVIEPITPNDPEPQIFSALRRLHQAVETPFEVGPNQWTHVRLSAGIAVYPSDGLDGNTLLRLADAALYQVKMHKHHRQQWWQMAGQDPIGLDDVGIPSLDRPD